MHSCLGCEGKTNKIDSFPGLEEQTEYKWLGGRAEGRDGEKANLASVSRRKRIDRFRIQVET